jgi:hypothetical protein
MGGAFSHSNNKSSSTKKRPEISEIDRAVLDLKNARDRLQKYRAKLEQDDAKLVEKARQAKQDNKPKQALGLLRLRRYKQRELENVEAQLLTVLQVRQKKRETREVFILLHCFSPSPPSNLRWSKRLTVNRMKLKY